MRVFGYVYRIGYIRLDSRDSQLHTIQAQLVFVAEAMFSKIPRWGDGNKPDLRVMKCPLEEF